MNSKMKVTEFQIKGNYIKAENIEQNEAGDLFAIAYMDDGYWHLLVFDFLQIIMDLDINSLFGIDNHTLPISGFFSPFASCCILSDKTVFFNFFIRRSKTHCHFVFDPIKYQISQQLIKHEMKDCTQKNFPQRTYYDEKKGKVFTFYRQGQAMTAQYNDITDYTFQQITKYDIGEMEIYRNQVLMVRSSHQILFFK